MPPYVIEVPLVGWVLIQVPQSLTGAYVAELTATVLTVFERQVARAVVNLLLLNGVVQATSAWLEVRSAVGTWTYWGVIDVSDITLVLGGQEL